MFEHCHWTLKVLIVFIICGVPSLAILGLFGLVDDLFSDISWRQLKKEARRWNK